MSFGGLVSWWSSSVSRSAPDLPRTTTFSKTPISQLLKRQAATIRTRRKSRPVHGHPTIPPLPPAGWRGLGPPPPAPPGGVELGDATGPGVPPLTPGVADGAGEDAGDGDACDVVFGLGDGLAMALGIGGLIEYAVQAGVEFTEVSVPHTMYEPGAYALGGAVDGVELTH